MKRRTERLMPECNATLSGFHIYQYRQLAGGGQTRHAECRCGKLEPPPPGNRGGATFDRELDGVRLNGQMARVFAAIEDGIPRTLRRISELTGDPEASISARARDLRKPQFGGHDVKVERVHGGTWTVRLVRE